MATWRDKMGEASFRGVPFFVETGEYSGGRRTVNHEYPLRDAPFSEDMGRKARSFSVEGHVVGDDYLESRDALIAALEEQGPGELVHPYYGTRRVAVEGFRVRESTAEGGVATFSVDFKETEATPRFPDSAPAAAERVEATAVDVEAALRSLAAGVSGLSLPAYSLASLTSVVGGAAVALDLALSPVVAVTQELAALKKLVGDIGSDAAALAGEPATALDALLAVFDALPALPSRQGVDALLAAHAFEPEETRPAAVTTTRAAEQAVYDVLLRVAKVVMVTQAAKLAARTDFDSYDEAVLVRDAVAAALDEEAETADDETYAQLEQLRADLVRAVPGEDSDLPRLAEYTPAFTVPSLVLAHRLYGNIEREADLVLRNSVKRPGFLTGGVTLEVLSDA